MSVFVVRPKVPCLITFAICLCIHLAIFIYGCVNVVWYVMTFSFIMTALYVAAIVFTLLRSSLGSAVVVGLEAMMLFLQFLAFILSIIVVAAKPVEGIDVVYEIFPPGENFIPTYSTLAWALFTCLLLLLGINAIGLLASAYNFAYRKYNDDDEDLFRG